MSKVLRMEVYMLLFNLLLTFQFFADNNDIQTLALKQ